MSIRTGKKGDLSDCEHDTVVGARWTGLSVSKTADIPGFSGTNISRLGRERTTKKSNDANENALLM